MNNTTDTPPLKETIYIVAGNYTEFKQYVAKKDDAWRRRKPEHKQNTSPEPKYVYVKDLNTLMGISNIKGYFIGSYRKRADFIEIRDRIDRIKAVDDMIKVLHEIDVLKGNLYAF